MENDGVFVDSHAHLQWESFDVDREEVLKRAKDNQVEYMVNIGFDIDACVKGVKLADTYSSMYATVGIHPHNASQFNKGTLSALKTLAANPKVVAIGEIGLDYFRNLSSKEAQINAFESQLLLAKDLSLPVVIHDRDAHDDIFMVLSKLKGKIKGVMHCFSGTKEFAQKCVKQGLLISFAGNVTYPKAYQLHEAAQCIDLKDLLIETDCPFLAPQSMRGKRNEPSYLPMTAKKIADLKSIPVDKVAEITAKNAKEFYKF